MSCSISSAMCFGRMDSSRRSCGGQRKTHTETVVELTSSTLLSYREPLKEWFNVLGNMRICFLSKSEMRILISCLCVKIESGCG